MKSQIKTHSAPPIKGSSKGIAIYWSTNSNPSENFYRGKKTETKASKHRI